MRSEKNKALDIFDKNMVVAETAYLKATNDAEAAYKKAIKKASKIYDEAAIAANAAYEENAERKTDD